MTEAVKNSCNAVMHMQVLEQYANIKHRDQLRCNAAFFMGLLKQVADKKQTAPVLVVPKPAASDLTTVSPDIKQKLTELYSQGILEPALMDQHCLGLLAALPRDAQLSALTHIAVHLGETENKRGYITQLLKNMRASGVSVAGTANKTGLQPYPKAGGVTIGGKVLSNTGKLINPNDVSIRLNPSSIFYDAELAMCWRVLSKQDKCDWQIKLGKGKQMKLANLSQPRQKLAQQLHPGHPQYHAATAVAWKYTDAAAREGMLLSADETGEAIKLLLDQPNPAAAAEPEFHDFDFPPLGGPTDKQASKQAGALMEIGSADLHGSALPKWTSDDSVDSDNCPQTALQTDTGMVGAVPASHAGMMQASAGDLQPKTLPLYNMGMAFQQSLSLQDISKSDPSRPSADPLAFVSAAVITCCLLLDGGPVQFAQAVPHSFELA